MKNIGNTKEGNHLVEMNRDEFRLFTMLHKAVTGESEFGQFNFDPARELNFDFSNTFHVIAAYYASRFRVTELQRLLDNIKGALSKPDA